MGMDFKKEQDEERTSLVMDRDTIYSGITMIISGAIPLNNKLKNKTNEELTALYPTKAAEAIAVRDWLVSNSTQLKDMLEEFKALLET